MTNIKLEAMEKKIEDILRHTDLKEWQIEDITKELLDLYNVNDLLISFAKEFQANRKWDALTPEEMAEIYLDE